MTIDPRPPEYQHDIAPLTQFIFSLRYYFRSYLRDVVSRSPCRYDTRCRCVESFTAHLRSSFDFFFHIIYAIFLSVDINYILSFICGRSNYNFILVAITAFFYIELSNVKVLLIGVLQNCYRCRIQKKKNVFTTKNLFFASITLHPM